MPPAAAVPPDRQPSFASPLPLAQAVARLQAATRERGWRPPATEAAVGAVSADHVVLERHIPHQRNAFRPVFTGRFRAGAGTTVLAGRFAMHWSVRVFLGAWFGFGALWTGAAAVLAFNGVPRAGLMLPVGAGLLLVGAGLVALGRRLAHDDIAWLSARIAAALDGDACGDGKNAAAPPPP